MKGKGSMKTFWLDRREFRKPYIQNITPGLPPKSPSILLKEKRKLSVERRGTYAPITFQDLAKRTACGTSYGNRGDIF